MRIVEKTPTNLLLESGFNQKGNTTFEKKNYKAIIWANGDVTLAKYTPNFKKFLQSNTYDLTGLESELKLNHHLEFHLLNVNNHE